MQLARLMDAHTAAIYGFVVEQANLYVLVNQLDHRV